MEHKSSQCGTLFDMLVYVRILSSILMKEFMSFSYNKCVIIVLLYRSLQIDAEVYENDC